MFLETAGFRMDVGRMLNIVKSEVEKTCGRIRSFQS